VVVAGVHVLAPGQKVTVFKENKPVVLVSKAQTAINSVVMQTPSDTASAAVK
jgi:hypothetical protein